MQKNQACIVYLRRREEHGVKNIPSSVFAICSIGRTGIKTALSIILQCLMFEKCTLKYELSTQKLK